jgi:predicted  nucleic acid-binding Zn-ribbon protein
MIKEKIDKIFKDRNSKLRVGLILRKYSLVAVGLTAVVVLLSTNSKTDTETNYEDFKSKSLVSSIDDVNKTVTRPNLTISNLVPVNSTTSNVTPINSQISIIANSEKLNPFAKKEIPVETNYNSMDHSKDIDKLKIEVASLADKMSDLQNELSKHNGLIYSNKQDVSEVKQDISIAKQEAVESKQLVSQLDNKVQSNLNMINDNAGLIDRIKGMGSGAIDSLAAKFDSFKSTFDSSNNRIASIEGQIETVKRSNDTLLQDIKQFVISQLGSSKSTPMAYASSEVVQPNLSTTVEDNSESSYASFSYVGYNKDSLNRNVALITLTGKKIYEVYRNDVINDTWKITSINKRRLVIKNVKSNKTKTLRIQG